MCSYIYPVPYWLIQSRRYPFICYDVPTLKYIILFCRKAKLARRYLGNYSNAQYQIYQHYNYIINKTIKYSKCMMLSWNLMMRISAEPAVYIPILYNCSIPIQFELNKIYVAFITIWHEFRVTLNYNKVIF